jgi:PAS domain S-box-containing protein
MKDNYHILVLDDDLNQRELLKSYLELSGPYSVDTVGSVEVFWPTIEGSPYDVMFLDYKLKGTNGLELLDRMAERSIHVPVIMISGEGDERIAAQAIQRGAVDYIIKDEDVFSGITAIIQKAIRLNELKRSVQQSEEQVRFQAMLLDNVRDAVVVWDLSGKIIYWNPAAHVLFGWSASEQVGKSVHDSYLNGFNPPVIIPKLEDSSGYVVDREYTTKDHRKIWVSSRLTPLRSEKNTRQLIGYMDVSRDVTQRKKEQQALKESQRFVQKIVDTTPNLLFIYDLPRRTCIFCNHGTLAILGMTPAEIQNLSWDQFLNLIHPDDHEVINRFSRSMSSLSEGQINEIELRVHDQQGRWHWLVIRNAVFFRNPDGSSFQVIGVAQEITDRKQDEARMERQVVVETLIATLSANFLNIDIEHFEDAVTGSLYLMSGFLKAECGCLLTIDEESGRLSKMAHWYSHEMIASLCDDDAPYFDRIDSSVIRQLSSREDNIILRKGQVFGQNATIEKVMDDIGIGSVVFIPLIYNTRMIGVICFGGYDPEKIWFKEDLAVMKTTGNIITNALVKRTAELALRESESRYRAIVEDHQTEMIFRFLPNAEITFANENFCHLCGKSRSDLLGTKFLELLTPESSQMIGEMLENLAVDNPARTLEVQVGLAGFENRWYEWTIRVIFNEAGSISEYQTVGHDITERKQMEAQIVKVQTKLTQATRLVAIGELAAGVAHQISNPLTTIIAEAQILGMRLRDDPEGTESTQAIETAGWRAQQVVQELMKFSQAVPDDFGPVQINKTIEAALTLLGADIRSKNIDLSVNLDATLPVIYGNERQLEDLWVNLLLVMKSFVSETPNRVIRISSCSEEDSAAVIEFSDNGRFISNDELEHIFEPSLIPTSNRSITGMELSICREITRQNHGEIIVKSSDQGTTFHVKFIREGPHDADQYIGD